MTADATPVSRTVDRLLRAARRRCPPGLARAGRRLWVRLRYRRQVRAARRGYRRHGDRYPHPVLYVAGLPKSGTSWLESMLASFPGYREVLIPAAVDYELATGGSHDFPLPRDLFERHRGMLAVMKLHAHARDGNAELLHRHGVPYVVLFRDLRDVAVSHHFYVRRTPWHPEFSDYAGATVEEGLLRFAGTLLPAFVDWLRSWRASLDPDLGMTLRYEELLVETGEALAAVARHLGLGAEPARLRSIVDEHSFRSASGGRAPGEEDRGAFVRKGVSGDWRNHFTPRVADAFRAEAGEILSELGYEPFEATGAPRGGSAR